MYPELYDRLVLFLFDVLIPKIIPILFFLLYAVLCVLFVCVVYRIYEAIYYKSKRFLRIKASIRRYTDECNELNSHIEKLKKSYINLQHTDYGSALYRDNSVYNFSRPKLKNISNKRNVYECSLSVCKNAQQQPFKYVCKYFNIEPTESTLEKFEKVFNDFSAAEQGKKLLKSKKEKIINSVSKEIPFLIKKLSHKKISRKLGFDNIDFSNLYFPRYTFLYTSAGGNSSMKCEVIFNLNNLERFISYLSERIKFRKSVIGQRTLMTSKLREKIKRRDNYTCQICGISTRDEPHLLLEIDHIVPLAKNGLTTEDNLQTLCWKCNRSKGAK